MNYTHIIWDFNGTILNDVQTGIDAVNALLVRYGKRKIESAEDYREVFCFPVIDYYEKIGLERDKFPIYAPEWVKEYNDREQSAPIFEGVTDLMTFFRDNKLPQYLLSATEMNMLVSQVNRLGIADNFEEIIGQNTIEAHGKIGAALEFMERVKPAKALFIGDSIHDYEAARAIGCDCVLLACGHQSRVRLEVTGCRVFDNAFELLSVFKNGEL